jgi:hypothetical protein
MGKILDSKANALRPPTEGDWRESPTKRQLSKFQREQPTVRTPPKGIDVKVLNERLLNLRKHLDPVSGSTVPDEVIVTGVDPITTLQKPSNGQRHPKRTRKSAAAPGFEVIVA